ncbi:MAG: sigma-54 interaction domain-containing protein [Ignavibacteriales bacterium]
MGTLSEVRDFAQAVADAIAAVIGVEVGMVDERLVTVVGSGTYARNIGKTLDPNCVSARVLSCRKTLVVRDPPDDELCRDCGQRDSCTDAADIITPLNIDGRPAGCLLLVACTKEQKDRLLNGTQHWVCFVEKMTDLISKAFNEREQAARATALALQFDTLINSMGEGILTLDDRGIILYASRSASRLLKVSTEELVSRPLNFVFPQVGSDFVRDRGLLEFEAFSLLKGEKSYWLGTIKPMRNQGVPQGYVVTFRGVREIPRLVASYIRKERQFRFEDILGSSDCMRKVKEVARSIARGDSTILIQGESGTGKELFARAIHYESLRRRGPFVAINCAAIPEAILESELFGYEEGAFSGARRGGKPGKFELAHDGTIFLDEIGDVPLHLQAKLLRAIEDRMVDRLGGTRPKPVDIRIIAATNKDLRQLAATGEFREDLYYRLAVIPIVIPPLRKHREDIPEYAAYFIREYSRALGKVVEGIEPQALDALTLYQWPGNIRELANALEYAVNLVKDEVIGIDCLPSQVVSAAVGGPSSSGLREAGEMVLPAKRRVTRQDLVTALGTYGRSTKAKEAVAAAFGISRATLYRKLKEYGLQAFSSEKNENNLRMI